MASLLHMTNPIQIRKFDHVVFRVKNIARSMKFYEEVLGAHLDKADEALGLYHMKMGDVMIDLIPVDGKLGSAVGSKEINQLTRNVEHVCVRVIPFDGARILVHLDAHDVKYDLPIEQNYGNEGTGPSLYLEDPDGNVIELKGAEGEP